MTSFGSIVHRRLETLSMLEPAAPCDGIPAAAAVAPTSLASRPVNVRFRDPNLSSQLRDVMSTLLTRQTTESASTDIFVLGVKPNLLLPRKRRAMTRRSKARTAGECCAITAANAKAAGPLAVPGAAEAVVCRMVSHCRYQQLLHRRSLLVNLLRRMISPALFSRWVPSSRCSGTNHARYRM